MASNFAFRPAGLSTAYTVGGANTVTTSLFVVPVGQTATQSVALGNYLPAGCRISNIGTASLFINFAPTAAAASVSPVIGMQILPNTVETFTMTGPFLVMACASTFTVTVGFTPGEGL